MNVENKIKKLDIAIFAGYILFAVSAVILAINLPEISRTFSTSHSESGGIETARNMVILFVLLLAGMLAQRWGKKRFLTLGQYLIAVGFLIASVSPDYPILILALMLVGVGGGFSEALLNPLIVDLHDKESGKFLNISHAFYPIGIVGAALIFGELLTLGYSWRLTFQIAAAGALLVAILFTILRFPPTEEEKTPYIKLFASVLSRRGFWLFALAIIIAAAIESALTFWSRSYVATYLSDVPRAGAVAIMIFAGALAIGRFLSAYLFDKTSLNNILVGSAILGVGVSALIPLATSINWFYFLLALAGLATASFWPTILAEADNFLKVNTTILFVLLSGMGMIGFGLAPWIMGIIGDKAGLKSGFAIIPILFIALILLLVVERNLSKKAAQKLADFKAQQVV